MIRKKGMSLIEIMSALFVLSFAILSVASIFPAGLEMNRKTKIRIEALEVAGGIIQNLKDLSYSDPFAEADFCSLIPTNTVTNLDLKNSVVWGENEYPQAVLDKTNNYKYSDSDSRIFFRDENGQDTREHPDEILAAPIVPDLPAIRLEPLITDVTSRYVYNYGGGGLKSRLYRITVTVNIEDTRDGQFYYSYIQVISYKGDGLTLLPGY